MIMKTHQKKTVKPIKENPKSISAQELYEAIMKSAVQHLNSELLPLKRDIEDQKMEIKRVRMRNKELELEIKSIGIAISELGIIDSKVFNDMKNIVFDKISIVNRKGQINGRNEVRRFNLTPSSDKILIQKGNK